MTIHNLVGRVAGPHILCAEGRQRSEGNGLSESSSLPLRYLRLLWSISQSHRDGDRKVRRRLTMMRDRPISPVPVFPSSMSPNTDISITTSPINDPLANHKKANDTDLPRYDRHRIIIRKNTRIRRRRMSLCLMPRMRNRHPPEIGISNPRTRRNTDRTSRNTILNTDRLAISSNILRNIIRPTAQNPG